MTGDMIPRIGLAAPGPAAARARALAERLGEHELVEFVEVAAGREALLAGDLDLLVLRGESWVPPADPGVELLAVPRRTAAADAEPEQGAGPAAPGQGALLVEGTARLDGRLRRALAKLDHATSRLAVRSELGVLARLAPAGGDSLAASAMLEDGLLFLTATVLAPDGAARRTASHAGYPEDFADAAEELAERVAAELRAGIAEQG